MAAYRPYSVRTPAFDPTSGGIRVMHALHGWLLAKGQISFLNAVLKNPDFVGIYPEIYQGNDMNAGTVVRYILQTPGVMGTNDQGGVFKAGPTTFDPDDQIYVFSKIYDTFGVDDDHILFLPVINLHLFKNYGKKRNKTCFLVGKGYDQHRHPDDAIALNRDLASDQQVLADVLNECHTFYCYDRLTAMMEIARLCGCRVKYYGDFTKDQLALYEPGMNGITYKDGPDAPLHADKFMAHYRKMVDLFSRKLDKFITQTQK